MTPSNRDLEKLLTVAFGQLMLKEEYPSVGELVDKALPIISTHYISKSAVLEALDKDLRDDSDDINDHVCNIACHKSGRNNIRQEIKRSLNLES